jgi:hypothetical protein
VSVIRIHGLQFYLIKPGIVRSSVPSPRYKQMTPYPSGCAPDGIFCTYRCYPWFMVHSKCAGVRMGNRLPDATAPSPHASNSGSGAGPPKFLRPHGLGTFHHKLRFRSAAPGRRRARPQKKSPDIARLGLGTRNHEEPHFSDVHQRELYHSSFERCS